MGKLWDRSKAVWAAIGHIWLAKDIGTAIGLWTMVGVVIPPILLWLFTPASPFDIGVVAIVFGLIAFFLARRFAPKVRNIHHISMQAQTAPVPSSSQVLIRAYKTPLKWAHDYLADDVKLAAKGEPEIWDALRSAARAGEITIWGRPGVNGLAPDQYYKPPEPIPLGHWRDFGFDHMRCLFHEDERECGTEPDDSNSLRHNEKYGDLRVHEGEIKTRWPV